jgi:hypothetical protein
MSDLLRRPGLIGVVADPAVPLLEICGSVVVNAFAVLDQSRRVHDFGRADTATNYVAVNAWVPNPRAKSGHQRE